MIKPHKFAFSIIRQCNKIWKTLEVITILRPRENIRHSQDNVPLLSFTREHLARSVQQSYKFNNSQISKLLIDLLF